MGDAPFIAARIGLHDSSLSNRRARKGFFALLLEALHHSRRLQAERILHQYRHLIAQDGHGILREPNAHLGEDHHAGK